MTLRLVLVGIVAALGVTIPSQPDGHDWLGRAERWANSVLADWDTWRPGDGASEHKRERIAASGHECEQCRLARAALAVRDRRLSWRRGFPVDQGWRLREHAAVTHGSQPVIYIIPLLVPSPRSSTIRFEPIEVGADSSDGIAYELNRSAEGIDLVQPPAPAPAVAIVARPEPVAVAETVELDLADMLCGTMDEDLVDLPSLAGARRNREARTRQRRAMFSLRRKSAMTSRLAKSNLTRRPHGLWQLRSSWRACRCRRRLMIRSGLS